MIPRVMPPAGAESSTLAEGDTLLYEQLDELIIRVSDYMLRVHEALRQKVRITMAGEALELMNGRTKRLEHEAKQLGIE